MPSMKCISRGLYRVLDSQSQNYQSDSFIRKILSFTPVLGIATHISNCHRTYKLVALETEFDRSKYNKEDAEHDISRYSSNALISSLLGIALTVSAFALAVISLVTAVLLTVCLFGHIIFTAYHIKNPGAVFDKYNDLFSVMFLRARGVST